MCPTSTGQLFVEAEDKGFQIGKNNFVLNDRDTVGLLACLDVENFDYRIFGFNMH